MATDDLTEELIYQKTPQQLTTLLYEGCLGRLDQAAECLEKKDFLTANQLLQRCNDILYRLGGGLNYKAGLIADQLEALYDYMAQKIAQANIRKDREAVLEVRVLLASIYDAWLAASVKRKDEQTGIARQRAKAYDQETTYPNGNQNY